VTADARGATRAGAALVARGAALALALLVAAPPASAESPAPPAAAAVPAARAPEPEPEAAPSAAAAAHAPADRRARARAQRDAVARELADLRARLAAAAGADAAALASEASLLETTDGALAQLELALEAAEKALESEADAAPPAAVAALGEPPYGLEDLDGVQDALDAVRARRARRAAAIEVSASELEAAQAELQRLEEARRLAREGLGAAAPDGEDAARRALRLAELESRRAEARRDAVAETLDAAKRDAARLARDEEALAAALARVRGALRVAPEALERALADVDAREGRLARALERARAEAAERQSRLARAQAALDATPPPAAALAAEVSARRTQARVAALQVTLLEEQLGRAKAERELWHDRRRILAREIARRGLRELDARLARTRDALESAARIWDTALDEVRSDARAAREASEKAEAEGSVTAEWREREARSWEEGVAAVEAHLEDLARGRRLVARVAADAEDRLALRGVRGAVEAVALAAAGVWDKELFAVDDRPITFGKLVAGLVLVVLGYLAARGLARLLGHVVRRRSRAAEGGVKAIESLAFYALLVVFVVFALDYVNIPLTAFTLLGGAVAVGVGFGSQTLMSNFISGLILLTERPIQVGDVIEIDGTQGTVDRIGPRSTRIRTFDNVQLIVPNATLIGRNVANWTRSDAMVRATVDVPIGYGADARAVTKLIRRAMEEHGQILERPEPVVLLHELGQNGLVFRASFSVDPRDVAQRGRIASDVRYRIERLFADHGIAVAHAGRPLQGEPPRPLEVRLVERPDKELRAVGAVPDAAGEAASDGEDDGVGP